MSGVEFVRQSSAPGGAKDGPRSEPFFDHGACESVSGRYEKRDRIGEGTYGIIYRCLLYTSPSPRDVEESRMPSSA